MLVVGKGGTIVILGTLEGESANLGGSLVVVRPETGKIGISGTNAQVFANNSLLSGEQYF